MTPAAFGHNFNILCGCSTQSSKRHAPTYACSVIQLSWNQTPESTRHTKSMVRIPVLSQPQTRHTVHFYEYDDNHFFRIGDLWRYYRSWGRDYSSTVIGSETQTEGSEAVLAQKKHCSDRAWDSSVLWKLLLHAKWKYQFTSFVLILFLRIFPSDQKHSRGPIMGIAKMHSNRCRYKNTEGGVGKMIFCDELKHKK